MSKFASVVPSFSQPKRGVDWALLNWFGGYRPDRLGCNAIGVTTFPSGDAELKSLLHAVTSADLCGVM